MNLSLHLFKTDLRHFRFWIAGHCAACLVLALMATTTVLPLEALTGLSTILLTGVAASAVLLVNRSVQADAQTGDSMFWKTRPVKRSQLLGSKAAFVATVALLPWLLANGFVWLRAGLDAGQIGSVLAESLLYALPLILFAAAVSSATRKLPEALGMGFGLFGGMMLWVFALEWISMRYRGTQLAWDNPNQALSGAVIFFTLLALFSGLAWGTQALLGRRRAALILLASQLIAAPLAWRLWPVDFISNEPNEFDAVRFEVIEGETPTTVPAGSQLLWSHFQLEGLPDRHFASLVELTGVFGRSSGSVHTRIGTPISYQRQPVMRRLNDSSRRHEFLTAVKQHFPSDTLWFGQRNSRHGVHLPVTSRALRGRPKAGFFGGKYAAEIVEIQKRVEAPLKPGKHRLGEGIGLEIRRVKTSPQGFKIGVIEHIPRILFDEQDEFGAHSYGTSPLFYVVYHAASKEAFPVNSSHSYRRSPGLVGNVSALEREFEIPFAAIRGKLTGVDRETWLKEARLLAFLPRVQGSIERHFSIEDYEFQDSRVPYMRKTPEMTEIWKQIQDAELNVGAPQSEVKAHIDLILSYDPKTLYGKESKILRQKLESIGATNLHLLLERLPKRTRLWSMVVKPAINHMAKDEHVPALAEALRREPELADMLRRKKRLPQARPVVLEIMRKRERVLNYDEFAIAASAQDPAIYEDLVWHAMRAEDGYATILTELSKCPGFDLEPVIEHAWRRARIGYANERAVAPWAAKLGHVDGFQQAVLRLESHINKDTRKRYLGELRPLVEFNGTNAELEKWLLAKLGEFEFDEAKKKFVLN